jgi:hypothetical protein
MFNGSHNTLHYSPESGFIYLHKNYKLIFSGGEGMKIMAAVFASGTTYDTFCMCI